MMVFKIITLIPSLSAATVINRVSTFGRDHINRVAKVTDFPRKWSKGFERWAAHPNSTFLGVPTPPVFCIIFDFISSLRSGNLLSFRILLDRF